LWTDGHLRLTVFGRLGEVDLKIINVDNKTITQKYLMTKTPDAPKTQIDYANTDG